MGWGLAGLLGGIGGGLQAYGKGREEEEDRKSKERIAAKTNEVRELIQQMKGTQAMSAIEARQRGKETLMQLAGANNLDLQALKNDGMAYVRKLQNDGMLDVEDVRALSRMNLKEIDKDIQAAHDAAQERIGKGHDVATVTTGAGHDRASVAVGAGHDIASNYGADMRYSSATEVANINQEGANTRQAAEMPLKIFRANQGRYPRGSAAARATRLSGGNVSTPTFGPSYADFMAGGGALPPSAEAAKPPSSTPGMSLPPMPGANFSPSPQSMFPPPRSSFSATPPPRPPTTLDSNRLPETGAVIPGSTPPPAAMPGGPAGGPWPLAGTPKPSLGGSFLGPQAPAGPELDANRLPETGAPVGFEPGLSSRGFVGYKSPEPGGQSKMTGDRIEAQANELMDRIKAAQTAGKFQELNSLKQQLRDLMKQHPQ